MAHPCFECGGECYCNGDIDDVIVSKTPKYCEGCGCSEFWDGEDDDDEWEEDPDPTCDACGYNHGNHMKGCPEDDSPFALLIRRGFD
jgi:hypothetical protein